MGLDYGTQDVHTLVGTKSSANALTGWALTASYQTEGAVKPTKTFDVGGFSRVEFAIAYAEGSAETANTLQVKVEFTPDGTNFYQLATDSTSGSTSTEAVREFTMAGVDSGTLYINFGLDIAYKDSMRISFKETGVASNFGTVYCEAVLSGR